MNNEKFSKHDKNKKVNIIIEIRKSTLEAIRKSCDNIDSMKYTPKEQEKIKQEFTEIAEMIRDKDMLTEQLNNIKKYGNKNENKNETESLAISARKQVIKILHFQRANIVATQYNQEELEIVDKELKEMEHMILEKDRLLTQFRPKKQSSIIRSNLHLNKYFNMDEQPNL